MMRRRTFLPVLALAAAAAATAFAVARPGDGIAGRVVDAVSGRVPAAVTITVADRTLRRFRSPEFAFTGLKSGPTELVATAPGYEPARMSVSPGTTDLEVALRPVDFPGLSGVIAFPEATTDGIAFSLTLRGEGGRALDDFPAVPLSTRLEFRSAAGEAVGSAPLGTSVDFAPREPLIRAAAPRDVVLEAAPPAAASFVVVLAAGARTAESRAFPLDALQGGAGS